MSRSLNQPRERDAPQILGALDGIPDGGFAEAAALIDGETASVILHRAGDCVRAWSNVCPHKGRRLDWSPGQFLKSRDGLLVCAVHGASFETTGGVSVAGPCRGDRLRAIAVDVADGMVVIRTSG